MAVELAQEIDITLLQPHPRNVEIYGEEDVTELVDYIRDSKWIKPLVISQHNRIISGHRRWQAAKALGLTRVPYVMQVFETETHELMALLLENASRDKNPAQKVHEADAWTEIEGDEAWKRQASGLNQYINSETDIDYPSVRENFPYPSENGRTRDKLAERVGFGSGKTYEAAKNVVNTAKQLTNEGKVEEGQALLKVLNQQSVNAATRVLSMPEPQKESVLQTIASGKASTVKQAEAVIKQEAPPSEVDEEDDDDLMKMAEKARRDAHVMGVMGSSDSPEWYTPREIVNAVLKLMGSIELDPCSNSHETPKVPASTRYTKDDDGLSLPWKGKTYLNPPYGSEIGIWTNKLIEAYESGDVEEAVALLPGRIDTNWFNPLYEYRICIIKGRVQFENSPHHAPFPCVLVYLGARRDEFTKVFSSFGPIVERIA
jgi:hypothetical protein